MADKRVFTIEIDGVEKSYNNVIKLSDALEKLGNRNVNLSDSTEKAEKSSRSRGQSITEQEKAERKLADTQDRASRIISQLERQQALANQQLRERTRAINLDAQAENASNNTIEAKKVKLAQLREEFKRIEIGSVAFEKARQEIEELDAEIKKLAPSTNGLSKQLDELAGNLSDRLDSIGNSVNEVAENTKGMLTLFQAGVGTLALFGDESESTQKLMADLGKVLAIVGALQQANNMLVARGGVAAAASAISEKAYAIQVRLRATAISLANKETITATILNKSLNTVLKASPLMWLVGALALATTSLTAFALGTDKATGSEEKFSSSIDKTRFASEAARDSYDSHITKVRDLNTEYRLLIGTLNQYQAALLRIANDSQQKLNKQEEAYNKEREEINNKYQTKWYNNAVQNQILVKQRNEKLKELEKKSAKEISQITTNQFLETNNEIAKYNKDRVDAQEQLNIDLLDGQEKEIAINQKALKEELKDVEKFGLDENKIREKYAKEENKIKDKYRNQNTGSAKQSSDKESELLSSLQKTRNETAKLEQQNILNRILANRELISSVDQVNKSYSEQAEIFRNENAEAIVQVTKEYDILIAKAQSSGVDISGFTEDKNKRVKALEEQLAIELDDLDKNRLNKVKDVNDKVLQNRQEAINIENAQLDNFYDSVSLKLENLEVRNSKGVINVDATRKNITEVNSMLKDYSVMLSDSSKRVEKYYDEQLEILSKDSNEYIFLQIEKENALRDFGRKQKDVLKQSEENTKKSVDAQKIKYQELHDKVAEVYDSINMAASSVFSAIGSVFEAQLKDATEKLEAITEKYDEVVQKVEESNKKIDDLENQAKDAKGGRLLVLQEQIDAEIQANQNLVNQENQLAKEKEKQEREIAKKEKQQKKAELTSNIVEGLANTALGVTKALSSAPPPFNFALAALVGAMGAVQIGVITKQLTKLENGGLLKGKRHSNGGMRVEGTNIEVEGGEYVVNRDSTNKNLGLIKYINSQRRTLGPNDLSSFFAKSSQGFEPPFKRMFEAGGQLPAIENTVSIDNEALVEAIQGIKIEPKVSVTDINNAQNDVVKVDNWTGL